VKSLKLNSLKDCQKHRIKELFSSELKFPLSQFVKFTSMQLSNHSERKKLILNFLRDIIYLINFAIKYEIL
jgi:hypothetical protein